MLCVTKECIYLAEGGEAASCQGADEAIFFSIIFHHGFGGRKPMFREHEVEVKDEMDN